MRVSVHDNSVYAQAVDYERGVIVLHTVYPHSDPPEHTDVVFEGVVVHHFEQEQIGHGGITANILFDVEEADAPQILGENEELLRRAWRYGWPALKYDGLDDLAARLTALGAKCFRVSATCGLNGFVFATAMHYRARLTRAETTACGPGEVPSPTNGQGQHQ